MLRETRILLIVLGVLAVVVIALTVGGRVRQEIAPEPRAAWVAIAVGDGPAIVGPVELEAGTPFTLHAVLEADTWRGERVYFTNAPALRIHGRPVPPAALRRWRGPEDVRVLWFTVEGFPPYLEVRSASDLERLQFREVLRAGWPLTWSVPGSVEPSRRRQEVGVTSLTPEGFGTQRFHVRIELFGPGNSIVPRSRTMSWGAEDLRREGEGFPTVIARLPDGLAVASSVFGLPQLEPARERDPEVDAELAELFRRRLAFSRVTLLREILERAGRAWDELDWQAVDLQAGPEWRAGAVVAGDLLRVGERFVVLAADRGLEGRLDYDDLGLDFDNGSAVRRLGAIFTGEGLVEWAPAGARAGGA